MEVDLTEVYGKLSKGSKIENDKRFFEGLIMT